MSAPLPAGVLRRADTARHPGSPFHAGFLLAELVTLVLLLALAWAVRGHPGPLPGDVPIEVDAQKALLPHAALRAPLEAISTLDWPKPAAITLAAIVALFLLLRRWLDAIVVPVAAGVESISTLELSRWVHRPRPLHHGVHPIQYITSTYSFPSGHVAYAVAVFGLLLFLTTQVRRPIHPLLIGGIRLLLVALIVLMPVSRVMEGEHWPSDTLGGALDGLFWLVLFAHVYLSLRARWPALLARDER